MVDLLSPSCECGCPAFSGGSIQCFQRLSLTDFQKVSCIQCGKVYYWNNGKPATMEDAIKQAIELRDGK